MKGCITNAAVTNWHVSDFKNPHGKFLSQGIYGWEGEILSPYLLKSL